VDIRSETSAFAFTKLQIVWKGSTKVGCGVAYVEEPNPSNPAFLMASTYVVAQYQMPGNMMGDFRANVQPLKGGGKCHGRVPMMRYGGKV
jgi:hypothetical protein